MTEKTLPWPQVLDEFATVKELATGKSIARFGDGEFKLIGGGAQVREPANEALGRELQHILRNPDPNCLVGIPTMNPNGPKYHSWSKHINNFLQYIDHGRQYYSAFITRPDSAPWIFRREYAEAVQALWAGKRVSLVCERDNKIFKLVKQAAGKILHTECPHRETYAIIDQIEDKIIRERGEIAVLSCGPAATCLANRLASRGVQTLDFGSMGGFMLKALAVELERAAIFVIRQREDQTKGDLSREVREAGFDVAFSSEDKW
jgi:hypothetical protein